MNDGTADSNVATVTIIVSAVNDAPVAVDEAYTGQWNTAIVAPAPGVLANDGDIDGDMLGAILVAGPTNGTLALTANGGFAYVPNANYQGADAFSYKANDGTADSTVARVRLTITSPCPPRRPRHNDDHGDDQAGRCGPGTPRPQDDSYQMRADHTLTVSAQRGVRKNDGHFAATVELWGGPANGTLALAANGSFVYAPAATFAGTDVFSYVARNAAGVAGPVTKVTIQVRNSGHDTSRR